jgi:hypothetical protein
LFRLKARSLLPDDLIEGILKPFPGGSMRIRSLAFLVLFGEGCASEPALAPSVPPRLSPSVIERALTDGLVDSDVVAELHRDFEERVERGPYSDRIREAKKMIDGSDSTARWRDYMDGLALLRRFRNDAAIPLLLVNLYEHPMRAGCTTFDELLRSLGLLAGEDFPRRTTTVETDIRKSIVVLLRDWYLPQRTQLTVVPEKMTPARFRVATRRILEEVRRRKASHYESKDSPEALAAVFNRDGAHDSQPGWYPEELTEAMYPSLLEWAGDPDYRYSVFPLLASLRKNGKAGSLHEVVSDQNQTSGIRFTALVALWKAGEDLDTPALVKLLGRESGHELKIAMILVLGQSNDQALSTEALLGFLEDRNTHVRTAAVIALRRLKPAGALPSLKKFLERRDSVAAVHGALSLLSEMNSDEARTAVADFLKAELDAGGTRSMLTSALHAFGTATGQRWVEAGAHDEAYYRDRARVALQWWNDRHK